MRNSRLPVVAGRMGPSSVFVSMHRRSRVVGIGIALVIGLLLTGSSGSLAQDGHETGPGPAARDLWLHEGDTVTRVDHLSGAVLDHWDVSHPDCPSSHAGRHVQWDGEAVWITIVDAEWEAVVLECVIRIPLDGSTSLEVYPVSTGRQPTFLNAAATHGGDLWAIAWEKEGAEDTLAYYSDWSPSRLDRWTGDLDPVLPRVVALAPSEAGLVVLYSERAAEDGARRALRGGHRRARDRDAAGDPGGCGSAAHREGHVRHTPYAALRWARGIGRAIR